MSETNLHVDYHPRWVSLAGVDNMRDLGGITTPQGPIRPGRLLRSDALFHLPADSVRTLVDDHNLTDVIDLRTNRELKLWGQGLLETEEDVQFHHLSLYPPDDPDTLMPPWVDELNAEAQYYDRITVLARHYLSYLVRRPDSILAALRVLAGAPGAVVVNCAAGKDRTGTVCAVTLAALGVDEEIIASDYAASTERVAAILARNGAAVAAGAVDQTAEVANQSTPAPVMRTFLGLVRDNLGGVPAWLADQGWTDQDQDQLVRRLVEP